MIPVSPALLHVKHLLLPYEFQQVAKSREITIVQIHQSTAVIKSLTVEKTHIDSD